MHGALMLALLLAALGAWQHAASQAAAPPGFERASSHKDLDLLYRENLLHDFAPYQSSKYGACDLLKMVLALMQGRPPKHLTLLLIRGNRVYALPLAKAQASLSVNRVKYIVSGLTNATKQGLRIQDTVMVLNTWDEPRCGSRPDDCVVPIFSLIKQWDWASSSGLQKDVLVPFFSHLYGDIITVPWDRKVPKALMRAAAQNGMDRNCTRLWLLELAKAAPGSQLLDVGITNNLKQGLKVQLANYVDIPSHAKWKYLISTDGFTASCRFGKLLQTNSIVLKEESSWIEYYYRSVKAQTHYFSFDRDNILQVLQGLEQESASKLQAVASSAQRFGYRYLSQYAKSLYFSRAVELYNAQFVDGAAFASSFRDDDLQSIDRVLTRLKSLCT